MYEGDSFFTLSGWGQVGLFVLSCALAVVMLALANRMMKRRALWLRVFIALALFTLFIWISPQVYYTYYRMIIDGLPAQWVVKPPNLGVVVRLLVFQEQASLSAHGQGLLGWGLFLLAVFRR